jgi:predicted Na+-dependent transporter
MNTLALVLIGWITLRLFRLSRSDSTEMKFEVIVRNTHLGVTLKASLFPVSRGAIAQLGDTVLFAVLFYAGLQLLIAPVLIGIYSRTEHKLQPMR